MAPAIREKNRVTEKDLALCQVLFCYLDASFLVITRPRYNSDIAQ
jgi:hypothetical protein